jgi:hypothetical protein
VHPFGLAQQPEARLPRLAPLTIAFTALLACTTSDPAAAQTDLCLEAERFMRDVTDMATMTEPDTIDDWRTRRMVPGCRVTAAGASRLPASEIVEEFYAAVEEAGWTRTPDPRDAPHEASLRYRLAGADCLFNYYDASMTLATDAELVVSEAVPLQPGESLYNFLVLCTPAAPAAPRGEPDG